MPQMILQRNYLLSSTTGHSIAFEKGVAVGVPPPMVSKALEIGAEFVAETQKEEYLPDEKSPTKGAPQGDARESAIFEAFRQLSERNDSADFTAGAKPKFKAVMQITGFRVDAPEVADMWGKFNEMKYALSLNGPK